MDDSAKIKRDRQIYQMQKKGFEDIAKAVQSPETQKIQILGAELVTIKGEKGDKGDMPSKEDLIPIIKPLIPAPIKGDKGDVGKDAPIPNDAQLLKVLKSHIPKAIPGKDGKDGKSIKGDKGDNGIDGKDGVDGSPDSAEDIISKLVSVKREWLPMDAILGDLNERVDRRVMSIGGGGNSLGNLMDVDLSGLSKDAQGNYILGSGSGGTTYIVNGTNTTVTGTGTLVDPYQINASGTGSTLWGTITGTLSDQTDLQAALDAKYDASNPAGYISDISAFTTDDLAEGATNFYYHSSLFDADFATKTTDDLGEGTTNLYSQWTPISGGITYNSTVNFVDGTSSTFLNPVFDLGEIGVNRTIAANTATRIFVAGDVDNTTTGAHFTVQPSVQQFTMKSTVGTVAVFDASDLSGTIGDADGVANNTFINWSDSLQNISINANSGVTISGSTLTVNAVSSFNGQVFFNFAGLDGLETIATGFGSSADEVGFASSNGDQLIAGYSVTDNRYRYARGTIVVDDSVLFGSRTTTLNTGVFKIKNPFYRTIEANTDDASVILGDPDDAINGTTVSVNAGENGIIDMFASVDVRFSFLGGDTYTLPHTKGSLGEYLKSNGDGTFTWDTPSGGSGMAIGAPVTGGTPNDILFIDAGGNLTQSDTFIYDFANLQLRFSPDGTTTPLDGAAGAPFNPWLMAQSVDLYSAFTNYNRSATTSATADFIAANDADDGTVFGGHFIDMGINSSVYDASVSGIFNGGANAGYIMVNGGSLALMTQKGFPVEIRTGGYSDDTFLQARFLANQATFVIGIAGVSSSSGIIRIGNTNGESVDIKTHASTTTWTLTLPADAGTNAYNLYTDGSGNTYWDKPSGGLVVGASAITSGTNTRVLYNDAGTLGEYDITGSGKVVMQTSPTLISPLLGTPTSGNFSTGTFTWPTFNQNTTGSAAKWTTARTLAGNSVDGSTNVAFANKFIVQGTADAGLSAAQFLGALGTGIVKNTTTTGVLSIASAGTDYEVPLTFSTGLTRSTNTITVNTSQNISTLSNLTANGFVKTSGGTGALSIDTNTYLTTTSAAATYQPLAANLTTLSSYAATGIVTYNGTTFVGRTLTGTANELTVTNGNGVSGNPTFSLPSSLTFTGKTITGGTFSGVTATTSSINGVTLVSGGTSTLYLSQDGTYSTPSGGGGSGDFVGPSSATDNAIVRFDTTTGKLGQNSAVTIGDLTSNTVAITSPSASTATSLLFTAGDASGTNNNGGNFFINGGAKNGTGIPGRTYIGTTAVPSGVGSTATFPTLGIYAADNALGSWHTMSAGGSGVNGDAGFVALSARGTLASPTASQSGDRIGGIYFGGYGTSYSVTGSIESFATENFTGTAKGTKLKFFATPNTTSTRVEYGSVDQDGTWLLTSLAGSGTRMVVASATGVLSTQTIPSGGGLTVGTSTITSGTTTRILYDNAGVLGEYVISGTGSVAMNTSPVITTPLIYASGQSTFQTAVSGSSSQFVGLDANPLRITFDTHNNASSSGTALMFRRSRGTAGTPLAVSSGDVLASMNARGYGTSQYAAASTGVMSFKANEAFTNTANGTYWSVDTTPDGSVTAAEAFRVTGAKTLIAPGYTTNGGLLYTNASGLFAQTGAGTSTTVLHGGTTPAYSAVVAADMSLSANKFLANSTGSTAAPTEKAYFTPGEQAYAGTLTWTGTTAPSGTSNLRYTWSQIGDVVFYDFAFTYVTSGTGLTAATWTMPTDMPSPQVKTGFTGASVVMTRAYGTLSTGNTAAGQGLIGGLRRNAANTGFEFNMTTSAGTFSAALLTGHYHV